MNVLKKKNKEYTSKTNKGWQRVIFKPGDWVWVHKRKEWFLERQRSMLQPSGDEPFQVLEWIKTMPTS